MSVETLLPWVDWAVDGQHARYGVAAQYLAANHSERRQCVPASRRDYWAMSRLSNARHRLVDIHNDTAHNYVCMYMRWVPRSPNNARNGPESHKALLTPGIRRLMPGVTLIVWISVTIA
jgi:hypothetical protein